MKKTKKHRAVKAAKKTKQHQTSDGKARAEGLRLFKLAGRPTKQDFVKVYGANGPKMTWEERAKAGVPAAKFQAALKAKQSGR
jgi:hypothetical protein